MGAGLPAYFMIGKLAWKRLLLADAGWFGCAALAALFIGFIGDQLFRHPPLGWRFQTAAQRVVAASKAQAAIDLVSLEELATLLARPDVIALDARPDVFY